MTSVLEPIRVVDLGKFISGPCTGMLLADLGADIVKVEQPGKGDPFGTYEGGLYGPQFQAHNACKRSLTLNLTAPWARDVLERLVADAKAAWAMARTRSTPWRAMALLKC